MVTDASNNASPPDAVTTSVTVGNSAPEANAGPDQVVDARTKVPLDASGSSDPDGGDTLSYPWEQIAVPSVALIFRVTVSDGRGGSASDVVTITVAALPMPAAPQNLTAEPGNGRVALSWDNPQDESIAGYQIRLRQAGSP